MLLFLQKTRTDNLNIGEIEKIKAAITSQILRTYSNLIKPLRPETQVAHGRKRSKLMHPIIPIMMHSMIMAQVPVKREEKLKKKDM